MGFNYMHLFNWARDYGYGTNLDGKSQRDAFLGRNLVGREIYIKSRKPLEAPGFTHHPVRDAWLQAAEDMRFYGGLVKYKTHVTAKGFTLTSLDGETNCFVEFNDLEMIAIFPGPAKRP